MGSHMLHYTAPARDWNEALPLGNGRIGAMIYGGAEKEILCMNEDTVWSGYPKTPVKEGAKEAYEKAKKLALEGKNAEAQAVIERDFCCCWSQAYLALCDIMLEGGAPLEANYERNLDCANALYTSAYETKGGTVKKESFISAPAQVFVYKVDGCKETVRISTRSYLRHTVKVQDGCLYLEGECPSDMGCYETSYPSSKYDYSDKPEEKGVQFLAVLGIKHTGGTVTEEENALCITGADSFTLYFSVKTSFNGFDKSPYLEGKEYKNACVETLQAAMAKDYEALKAEHVADFSSYFNTSEFALDGVHKDDVPTNVRLKEFWTNRDEVGLYELMFAFGKYLLISGSRQGTQAMNLQGIWNNKQVPPWNSNYTVNINTEMNYWCAPLLGMNELMEPLLTLVKGMAVTGRTTAEAFFGAGGFAANHNADLWAHTAPVLGSSSWSYFPFASGWLCNTLYRGYEYSGDVRYLNDEIYPLVHEAARFYSDILVEDENGYLIVCPQTSPENIFYKDGKAVSMAKYATMGMSIVQELFIHCLEAAKILEMEEDTLIDTIKEQLPKLVPFKLGSQGQLLEWDEEYEEQDPHHRHVSHLYALHPAELITPEQPELMEACKKTLELRGDDGTGWSLGWKINFHARLGNAESALKLMQMQLCPMMEDVEHCNGGGTYPNLFDAHPPFQIDGNFAFVSGICEMLVQSRGKDIYLLPACPTSWSAGKISGLKVKGGATIDFEWKDGKVTWYDLHGEENKYTVHVNE